MRRMRLLVALALSAAGCELAVDLGGLSDGVAADAGGSVDAGGPDAQDALVEARAEDAFDAEAAPDVPPEAAVDAPKEAAPPCAITLVSSDHANTTIDNSNSIGVMSSVPQHAGSYLVVAINHLGCQTVQGVTDTGGNIYARLIGPEDNGGAGALETWGARNIVAGTGPNAVTVTFSAMCPIKNVKLVEYAGVDVGMPVGNTTSTHGTGSAPDASLQALANDMLFAHTGDESTAVAQGAGWTLLFKDEFGTIAEQEVANAEGTYAVSYVPSSGEAWVIQALTLHCK